MASQDTLFVPKVTNITAAWIQPVNDLVWKGRNQLYTTSTNTGNAYTVALPVTSLYTTISPGDTFTWRVNAANTGAATLTVVGASSLGPKSITKAGAVALAAGDLAVNSIVTTVYDGTEFQVTNISIPSFLQTGLNTITRSLQSKVSDTLSVFDFMTAVEIADVQARTAGVNVTAAITAAITNASITGRSLHSPAGIYLTSTALATYTGVDGISFLGDGIGVTIFKSSVSVGTPAAGTAIFLTFSGCTNVTIQGITFDLNSIVTTNANTQAVGFASCTNIVFDHNAVINGTRLGIALNACNKYWITDNYFARAGGHEGTYQNEAILVSIAAGASRYGHVSRNTIVGWGTIFDGDDLHIEDNTITGWGYGAGITVQDSAGTNRPVIIGNTCSDSVGQDVNSTACMGIECWAAEAIISNNICYDNAGDGIDFGGPYSVVTNNICIGNGTYNNTGSGIVARVSSSFGAASYSIVADNMLVDPSGTRQKYGYSEQASGAFVGMKVFDNQFYNNITAETSYSASSTLTQFKGNVYEGSDSWTPGTLAVGEMGNFTVTVGGAVLGDFAEGSFSLALSGCTIAAYVNAANAVVVSITNNTTSSRTLGAGTVRARASQSR